MKSEKKHFTEKTYVIYKKPYEGAQWSRGQCEAYIRDLSYSWAVGKCQELRREHGFCAFGYAEQEEFDKCMEEERQMSLL
ncbi:MAG: hypothetical protein ACRDDX_10480 [Cellulosilyticaceae bacterium]